MASVEAMESKALELVQTLQRAPAFTSADLAPAILTFLLHKCNLTDLAPVIGPRDDGNDDEYFRIGVLHQDFKDNADKLGAASLALSLSNLQKDEYGFVDSANQVLCMSRSP